MERLGGEDVGQQDSIKKVALASFIGTTIEWYDFFIYGTAAALVFNQLFFPNFSPLAGTLAAFATFAVGFFARPVGGIIFGHFGDRIGRKTMLILTIMIMGFGTVLIGCLPTYGAIGVWAPILLVALRIFQGIGLGGEWGGAVLMAVEHSPANRRGFYGSWPQTGVPAGLLLSSGVFAIFSSLPEEQFLAWGWRMPFLLSATLILVGLFIRLRISETPAFTQVRETSTEARLPIVEVVRTQPKNVLLAIGARVCENASFYIFAVFVLAYATEQLNLSRQMVLTGTIIAAVVTFFTIPAFGALSDRVGRRPVYMGGAAFTALFAFPFFWLINTQVTILVWVALVLALAVGYAAQYGPQASFLPELFNTRVRYSGVSIGSQVAAVFAGGLAPLIATALLAWASGNPWPVSVYLIGLALITFVAVYLATETFRVDLSEEWPRKQHIAADKSATRAQHTEKQPTD